MKATYPIGVFDSGLGGLNILKELRKVLPFEDFAYLADNLNCPYGIKTKTEIIALVRKVLIFFENLPVKLVVLACNTSSAYLEELRLETTLPLIGVIIPTAEVALKTAKQGDLAVLATEATIDSGIYQEILKNQKRKKHFVKCSEFVGAIEAGLDAKSSRDLVTKKLSFLKEKKPGTFVLACTHFDLFKEEIQELFPEAKLITSGSSTAKAVKQFLKQVKLENPQKQLGKLSLYVTGENESFRNRCDWILNKQAYYRLELNN
ncbi:MAG TPA: glutamate racemase [Acholeplasmataceae bacterium]|jgi:glutamate racemase|nr:glutamate racemase [Acholeplasmataceae bacterium]